GLPGIISITPDKIGYYIAGMVIAFLTAFVLTIVLGMRDRAKVGKKAAA
ncbi:PTS maltose transporter subunit IIBC, partial [Vibrio parahaemolyticus]|nr:PTS maltose transporter subunit IIBC [Vibrio parahaemolyticus]